MALSPLHQRANEKNQDHLLLSFWSASASQASNNIPLCLTSQQLYLSSNEIVSTICLENSLDAVLLFPLYAAIHIVYWYIKWIVIIAGIRFIIEMPIWNKMFGKFEKCCESKQLILISCVLMEPRIGRQYPWLVL